MIAAVALAPVLAVAADTTATASAKSGGSSDPIVRQASAYELSAPVRDLPPGAADADGPAPARVNPLADEPGDGTRGTSTRAEPPSDPLTTTNSDPASGRTPAPSSVFDGQANTCGCTPPDTIGDVGPNHYIQMVNSTKVAIFNKSGTLEEPAFSLGSLWSSGPCTGDEGDPVVLYDPLADRWLLSQFAVPNQLCFAISQTSDPTGAYHLFTFNSGQFPDYFKVGVWPTGYYVSANESTYTAYAFDRTKMLAGNPSASFVKFPGETNFLLPADLDGSASPGSQGGLFYTFKDSGFHGVANDRLELFRLTPDFATPANSTFDQIETIPIAPFTYTVCGFFVLNCIRQQGTTKRVDAVSEWPMWRFPYRRFSDREVLLGNFTVGGGDGERGAAIRWFELRDTGSGWSLFQEGTHDEGGIHDRFMGSIAMDGDGAIALGYSVSSSSIFPSIRYATRDAGDPLGTLQAEQTLQAGGGSQTGSDRWGDYSAMSIDPATDCDFWYTNEYYNPSSAVSWKTAIGSFKIPACGTPTPQRTLNVSLAGTGSGTVTGDGIDCPGDCTQNYPDGTDVTLNASAAAGSSFDGWSGHCAGTGACELTMDADKAATATFNTTPTPQRTLNVSLAGTGSGTVTGDGIDCPGDCTQNYPDGTDVTLNASAAAGSSFDGWSGHCAGTGACELTMDADKAATATFNTTPTPQRTLNVSLAGTGSGTVTGDGIDCPGDCTQSYPDGTNVTLNASAAAGSSFDGWSGHCAGTGACELTMDADKAATATFNAGGQPPSNDIEIGKPQRNAKKGTAKLPVRVPGAGDLELEGKKVKRVTKDVFGAGTAKLAVKPKKKLANKLDDKGSAKPGVDVTFTPVGGEPNTESKRIKLKQK